MKLRQVQADTRLGIAPSAVIVLQLASFCVCRNRTLLLRVRGQAVDGFRTICPTTVPRVSSDIREMIPSEITQ